jgi:hypothetical protein
MKLSNFKISTQIMFIVALAVFVACALLWAVSYHGKKNITQTATNSMLAVKTVLNESASSIDTSLTNTIASVNNNALSIRNNASTVNRDVEKIVTDLSIEHLGELALGIATQIRADIERALGAARTLAKAYEGYMSETPVEQREREFIIALLKGVLEGHPEFLTVWTDFEPNAFDGRDAEFEGREDLGSGEDGLFVPLLYEEDGEIVLIAPDPEESPYLEIAQSGNHQEVVTNPYTDPDLDANMITAMVPIFADGEFIGTAGIDLCMENINAMLEEYKPHDTGYVYILDSEGAFVWYPDPSYIADDDNEGKNISDIPGRERIAEAARDGVPLIDDTVKDLTTGKD